MPKRAARFRPALGCRLRPARGLRSRGGSSSDRPRLCAWRMISSACRRRPGCGPAATGAIRPARRRARIAAPCVRRSFSVPTPYANAAHTRPPHASVRSLRAGYRKVNAGLGGAAARWSAVPLVDGRARSPVISNKRERRMGHIDPTKEVFAQFRANDRPGPIHMLNLVRLRAAGGLSRRPQGDAARKPMRPMAAKAGRCSNGWAAGSSGRADSN